MLKFQDNFSENHLLFGQDVSFIIYDETKLGDIQYFNLVLLKFADCFFDYKIQNFLHILNAPLQDITKNINHVQGIESVYSLCNALLSFPNSNIFYHDVIVYSLQKLVPSLNCTNNMTIQGHIVTEELFQRIVDIVLMCTNYKQPQDSRIMTPEMRAAQEKIDRIKKQRNNAKQNGNNSFLNSYMILTYEFNYTPEQILNMTMYCINTILKYTGKSINYKVSLIGAGNGLSKKINFITQEGK